ncbi:MAG: hypothetical protein ACLFR7_08800 [Opitutales bacterium]
MSPLAFAFPLPLLAQFDWGEVFYFLIPLAWVALQFLGNKKEKGDEAPPQEQTSQPAAEAEKEDRLRRVREEIRRRVAEQQQERQRELEGGQPRPVPSTEPVNWEEREPPPRRGVPPPVPAAARREAARSPEPPSAPAAPATQFATHSDLENRLQEQRRRLRESKEARSAAKLKATEIGAVDRSWAVEALPIAALRGEVLADLSSPLAARKAIILSEILGEPRALRPLQMDR